MHRVLEAVEGLPGRLRRLALRLRRVDRRAGHLHVRDIARAIGEDGARLHAHDQLRADGLAEQRIVLAHRRAAVDAQPLGLVVQRDEQQADMRVHDDVAEALEHAVAVVVGEGQFAIAGQAHEAGHAALERAVRPALGVRGGEEEIGRAFDEGLVVGAEGRARQSFLQPVGNAPAVEAVLKLPVAVVV